MLLGQYPVKVTEKGRIAIPAKFRSSLGKKLIVAKWYEGCLVIVSESKWNALLKRLTGKSEIITSPVRDTDRFILGSAFDVETDSQGRFVVPKILKKYSNLGSDAIILGLGDRLEVWNSKEWRKREEFIGKNAAEMVEKLADSEKQQ
jgi:MraZ protein